MNEVDILKLFYDEMTAQSVTRDKVFLSIDDAAVEKLAETHGGEATLEEAKRLATICIANEWLERTTADPYFKYLSLTENGLQVVLGSLYS